MYRSASIAIVLAGLASGLSILLREPEWTGPVPEVSGYVPLPPETEFFTSIELEKTRFLQGEQILVRLVTELGSGEWRRIPDSLLDDQRIIFTKPDGTTRVDGKPMRIDGSWQRPEAYGSRYDHRLRDETPQIGRWSVVFAIGSRRTEPAEFTVEAPAVLKDIAAHFEINTPQIFDPGATATLVVLNRSPLVLRIVNPGQNHSVVRGRMRVGRDVGLFEVPFQTLASAAAVISKPVSVERLDWDSINRVPHAVVAPGATWRLPIPFSPWLARAYDHLRGGDQVSMSTELQIFAGEPDGEWREFSPVRLEAKGATKGSGPH